MYYTWEFKLKDGTSVFAKFTDEEMLEREKMFPEVIFNWNG